jgi:TolB-like protein/DNA-binding winged helix-turn-helix (wHTH) protein/Flp pilus assembly protein TadD
MPDDRRPPIRFGVFEVQVESGELRKQGVKLKLQGQPFQALLMLIEHPGQVITREEFRRRLWPEDTFVDFDRGLNKAINRIRDAIGDRADSPRFIETLPQRGYRFIASVEAGQAEPPLASPRTARESPKHVRWLLGVAVLLAIAGALVLLSRVPANREALIASVAVLPLENLSGDASQEYFSDGLTDELIGELARISSLRVISRTSSMQYKHARKPLHAIAKELNVEAILEGTVARSGSKVRVTAQLIEAQGEERNLWSGKYERELRDVLTLQGEVAQAIAREIRTELTAVERKNLSRVRPVNPEAYEAYLKGTHFLTRGTEALDKSIESFNQAIAIDPAYGAAHGGAAVAYVYLGIFGLRAANEVYPKAKSAAIRALELDEASADAHIALGDVKKSYEWNLGDAESEFRRALQLNPSHAVAHMWYADNLSRMGRHDEAIAAAQQARALDPVSPARTAALGLMLYRARRYDEAIAQCVKALELDPNFPNARWFKALAHEQRQEFQQAISDLENAVRLSRAPLYRALLGHAYALAGNRAKAMNVLAELRAESERTYVSPYDIALIYAGLGNRDAAFRWLEEAYRQRVTRIHELPQPQFDMLRSDPRFADLMRRIGLPL